ncbi:MAG TPA: DUF2059 domain-containing protein [Gemmatimonadales bacterium]|nr:DUF2059 domain-containing protein [Gemmatimonadales bacterium]
MGPFRVRAVPLALLFLGFVVLPSTALSQARKTTDPEKLKVARQLVEASGAEELILKGIELTLPAQRAQNPKIPDEFWDRFAARARADVGMLVDSLAPVYAARFSQAELDQLLAFYQSPVGRHFASEQGAIAQESQQLGLRWGTRVGASIAVDLANEGKPLGR